MCSTFLYTLELYRLRQVLIPILLFLLKPADRFIYSLGVLLIVKFQIVLFQIGQFVDVFIRMFAKRLFKESSICLPAVAISRHSEPLSE